LSENQDNCPEDCYTTVTMTPSSFLIPDQTVTVTITFNDSRYISGKTVNFLIEIYNIFLGLERNWLESNKCVSNLNFTADAGCVSCGCSKEGTSYVCHSGTQSATKATSSEGYFKLEVRCDVPPDIKAGSKILKVSPIFYSEPVRLKPATNKFMMTYTTKDIVNLLLKLYNMPFNLS
jgi:hypothetical protein